MLLIAAATLTHADEPVDWVLNLGLDVVARRCLGTSSRSQKPAGEMRRAWAGWRAMSPPMAGTIAS